MCEANMAAEINAFEQSFSFRFLPTKKFSFLQDKNTLSLLMKWSMLGRLSALSFSFDCSFRPHSSLTFAQCFFRDPDVLSCLREVGAGVWGPLDGAAASVSAEAVPCSSVSMDLFDPIFSCGVLTPSGHVVRCLHDVEPDYDELRRMLQDEDSEHHDAVGREERQEFLFLLFKHLCVGGELCQHEDAVQPYMDTTRRMYKDLISVQKDPETKKISVVSTVLRVSAYDESGRRFPGSPEDEQTFSYLIVDPFRRHVTLLSHSYGVGSFTP